MEINFSEIEKKWQKVWEEKKTFEVSEDSKKEKFYVLEMFPYPSGTGLHMGHALNYTIGDILARFKIMQGFEVLHPMGYDALGLPAENAAIKAGTHPEEYTDNAIENFIKQTKALGVSYDWSRVVNTASPEFYRWDQWIFLKMLEKGLAYQKEAAVNWCPECNTVLANEQVNEGKCWRHEETDVEVRKLRQWFFRTTEYADELLEGLDSGTEDNPEFAKYTIIEKSLPKDKISKLKDFGDIEILKTIENWGDFIQVSVPVNHETNLIKFLESNLFSKSEDGGAWYADSIRTTNTIVFPNKHFVLKDKKDYKKFFDYGLSLGIPKEQLELDVDFRKKIEWPERTKAMQRNWIGRSEGTEIEFKVDGKGENNGTQMNADERRSEVGNVVIVHGSNSTEKEAHEGGVENTRHWHPWLREQLGKRGIDVSGELYPKDWDPNYEEWKKIFEKNNIEKDSILIGHSAGCAFILRWLAENKKKVKKVILVAPYVADDGRATWLKEFVDFDFDDSLKKYYDELIIFYDKEDMHGILQSVNLVNKKLGGKLIELKGRGHFIRMHMNTGEFPELLDETVEEENINTWTDADGRGHGKGSVWRVFTTRPDTIFGVTFMVVAAGHERLGELVTEEQRGAVDEFLGKIKSVSEKDSAKLDKEGVFTGSYMVNPANGERVPIWVGNFVLADYGSGMVMGVPAHDQRDMDFATKYGLEKKYVVCPSKRDFDKFKSYEDYSRTDGTGKFGSRKLIGEPSIKSFGSTEESYYEFKERVSGEIKSGDYFYAYEGFGDLINSGKFNKLDNETAKKKITDWLIKNKVGKKVVNFKLRDWGVSRQRYWGTPIPIVYCEDCGAVAVPEKDLPVVLPKDVKFGEGNPLESNEEWLNVACPKCGKVGRRESDTMDTFVNSSWYFLRYTDPKNSESIFDKDKVNAWNPVDVYVGGAEHACMHLLYARFYVKFLRDIGVLDFDEPFSKLFHQGMLHAEDGRKMSKSLGNVVDPLDAIKKYGVDATRWFLISVASPDKDFDWSEKGITGATRFIKKVYNFFDLRMADGGWRDNDSVELVSRLNLVIKNVGEYYGDFGYRKATIELRELFGLMGEGCSRDSAEKFLKILNPICPHVSEELWSKMGNDDFISVASWPEFDEGKVLRKGGVGDLNGKIIERVKGIIKPESKKVFIYVMPFEIGEVDVEVLKKGVGLDVEVFSVGDPGKVDPKGMAKRAKPGMCAVYLE